MKKRFYTTLIPSILSLLLVASCQKESISVSERYSDRYETREQYLNSEEFALFELKNFGGNPDYSPIILGKVLLDEEGKVLSGWLVDDSATLRSFQFTVNRPFSIETTRNSKYLAVNFLKNATELEKVNPIDLLGISNKIKHFVHNLYIEKDLLANSTDVKPPTSGYFTFSRIFIAHCHRVSSGCVPETGPDASLLTYIFGSYKSKPNLSADFHCTQESSNSIIIIPEEEQELVSYINSLVKVANSSN